MITSDLERARLLNKIIAYGEASAVEEAFRQEGLLPQFEQKSAMRQQLFREIEDMVKSDSVCANCGGSTKTGFCAEDKWNSPCRWKNVEPIPTPEFAPDPNNKRTRPRTSITDDIEKLWPSLEAGVKYLGRKSDEATTPEPDPKFGPPLQTWDLGTVPTAEPEPEPLDPVNMAVNELCDIVSSLATGTVHMIGWNVAEKILERIEVIRTGFPNGRDGEK